MHAVVNKKNTIRHKTFTSSAKRELNIETYSKTNSPISAGLIPQFDLDNNKELLLISVVQLRNTSDNIHIQQYD